MSTHPAGRAGPAPLLALVTALAWLASAPDALAQSASLIRMTDTSAWSSPSPDPSGVTFAPGIDRLIVADSEINETPLFDGANLFVIDRDGVPESLLDSTAVTDEPSGITFDPASGHLFIATDNSPRRIHEIDPGADGGFFTADDTVSSFSTTDFGSADAEGLAWDPERGVLHVVDGALGRVFSVDPGGNGRFDGVPPAGDDVVDSFDTVGLGVTDPEGVAFDPDGGHLYVVGKPKRSLLHVTVTGQKLRTVTLDTQALIKPAGLTVAPSSLGNGSGSLYLVDRGVDNDVDPTENDGRLFEFALPPLPSNRPPVVQIAAPEDDSVFALGDTIGFAGSATDPEEGDLSGLLQWESDLDGPLGEGAAISVAGLSAGVHEITASVVDAEQVQGIDSVSLRVSSGDTTLVQSRVTSSADDAEQRGSGGNTWLDGNDLELVQDGSVEQIVGLRFASLEIPAGADIEQAYIQFQADEIQREPVTLSIRAEDVDDAAPPLGRRDNLTNRPTTSAVASWSPPPWERLGDAGTAQRTADLSALVQEVVDRAGWNAGQAMLFLIEGSGPSRRTAESFDSVPDGAPLLVVRYSASATPPRVEIISPLPGTLVEEGDPVSLLASAEDVPDGDLGAAVSWSSSIDGALGGGAQLEVDSLSPGTHLIAARVSDSDGLTAEDTVTLEVRARPDDFPPEIAIVAPAANAVLAADSAVTLRATAFDTEDGDLADAVSWSSDRDGALGTGEPSVTLSVGPHRLSASVEDSGGARAEAFVDVTVEAPVTGPITVTRRIGSGADDVEQRDRGRMAINSGDLEMTMDGSREQIVGLRFENLAVPRGASIVSASVRFTVDEPDDLLSFLEIHVEDDGDAAPFSATFGDLSARARAPSTVPWSPAPWQTPGQRVLTPDLAPLVQHVVTRADWSEGNALVLLVDGDGKRVAESFEGNAAEAAVLSVVYRLDNTVPEVDAGPDREVPFGQTLALAGSASDADGDVLSVRWSLADGPAAVDFEDATALATGVDLPSVGVYRLRLTVDDGTAGASDTLLATVTPTSGNAPPTVAADTDLVVRIGDSVTLDGAVDDDGLPGAGLSVRWSRLSGPADVAFGTPEAAVTTASFADAGLYTLELAAFDGELGASDTVQVNVLDEEGGRVVTRVAAGSDDAEQMTSGWMKIDSSDLELVFDVVDQSVGLRFTDLAIPNGALIDSAHVRFTADESGDTETSLLIAAEATDDATGFTRERGSITSRAPTGAAVAWSPPPWTRGDSGAAQRTPDLSAVIAEVVSRPGWQPGNDLVLIVTGTGERVAAAFESGAGSAPELTVEFHSAP